MDANGEWWKTGVEFLAYVGGMFGINKWMNAGLSRRVKEIEDARKQEPKRTISDCDRLYEKCPTHENIRSITELMKRSEDKVDKRFDRLEQKLDRLIEKK